MTAAVIVLTVIVSLGTILAVEALNRVADALTRLARYAEAEDDRRRAFDAVIERGRE